MEAGVIVFRNMARALEDFNLPREPEIKPELWRPKTKLTTDEKSARMKQAWRDRKARQAEQQ